MSRAHIARLRQLSRSSDAAQVAGFLRGLTDADQELADTIAEETVSHMTSGQQQPPDPTLEDLADLSLDVPAREVDVETAHDPVDARDLGNPGDGEE